MEPGIWKLVEYLSKWLSDAEMNYGATEHEFVAMMLALCTWR